jgi:hypothetical protein
VERRARIDKFTFAGRTFDEPTVTFLQPGSAADVSSGRLGGIIGRGFLQEFILVTDIPNKRIAFIARGDTSGAIRGE